MYVDFFHVSESEEVLVGQVTKIQFHLSDSKSLIVVDFALLYQLWSNFERRSCASYLIQTDVYAWHFVDRVCLIPWKLAEDIN